MRSKPVCTLAWIDGKARSLPFKPLQPPVVWTRAHQPPHPATRSFEDDTDELSSDTIGELKAKQPNWPLSSLLLEALNEARTTFGR